MNYRPHNFHIHFYIRIFLIKFFFKTFILTRFLGISMCETILAYRGDASLRDSANRLNIFIKAIHSLTNYSEFWLLYRWKNCIAKNNSSFKKNWNVTHSPQTWKRIKRSFNFSSLRDGKLYILYTNTCEWIYV